MDNEPKPNLNVSVKKNDKKHAKKKKMDKIDADVTMNEVCLPASNSEEQDDAGSCSSTDSEELVNAMNYNTITSLAALKDIIQGDDTDTPETDTFFQHYFMNHCNNLSSRNVNPNSPLLFAERRRLSQCREEDEDDEKKDTDHLTSIMSVFSQITLKESVNASANDTLASPGQTSTASVSEEKAYEDEAEKADDSTEVSEDHEPPKRTVMGPRHKFLVTTTEPPAAPSPVERALRSQVHNAHTVHFGTKGAEELRPSLRSIFSGQNLHRDKHYFDSSLIEIRSTVDATATSSEDIWVKRTEDKQIIPKEAAPALVEPAQQDEKPQVAVIDKPVVAERTRSGTWGAQTARKEKETPVKKTPPRKDKEIRIRSTDDRRQKREQRLDAAITRSTQSVGERKRRGSADEGQPHLMYQQTIHGTSGVSRRPALFDIFKSRPRGDAKKQPSIIKQVKAAVQSMTKSVTPAKEIPKPEPEKKEVKPEGSATPVPAVKTRDGSAHPHPGSDTRYYHTVTASGSRRPSAMAKVMDIFRGRASMPGQTLPLEGPEKRKARALAQQQQYGIHMRQQLRESSQP